ncbi:MAG: hypothetical protein QGF74_00020 [Candidatus Nanoarchaeia archaeon]|jgi:hypothetical protein|nr:hypothetical protein [Candidatus Nanoarchaeia archaeon]|tara:strand:- start:1941 stop:2360 length:420 start_codon:yes stop_codon:yes gene_type:complete
MIEKLEIMLPMQFSNNLNGAGIVEGKIKEVERYELLLLKSRRVDAGLRLGVITNVKKVRGNEYVILTPCYMLGEYDSLGGIKVPKISNPPSKKDGLALKMFKEIVIGKREIVNKLRSWGNGYEFHADWIDRLRKPYLRE